MKAILAYCSRSPTFDPEPTFRRENQREAPCTEHAHGVDLRLTIMLTIALPMAFATTCWKIWLQTLGLGRWPVGVARSLVGGSTSLCFGTPATEQL